MIRARSREREKEIRNVEMPELVCTPSSKPANCTKLHSYSLYCTPTIKSQKKKVKYLVCTPSSTPADCITLHQTALYSNSEKNQKNIKNNWFAPHPANQLTALHSIQHSSSNCNCFSGTFLTQLTSRSQEKSSEAIFINTLNNSFPSVFVFVFVPLFCICEV